MLVLRDRSLFTRGGGGGGGRPTKLRKSLAKKLWPSPIKGLKNCDPPNTQTKKLCPSKYSNKKIVTLPNGKTVKLSAFPIVRYQ